jgi:small ligand-binding sensory domain FIST
MTRQILSPPGQSLKKAVQWISDKRLSNPEQSVQEIINMAGQNFDLSPKDLDFLIRKLVES